MEVILSKDIGPFKVQVIETEHKDYEVVYSCNGKKLESYEHSHKELAIQDYLTITTCLNHIRACLDGFSANTHKLNVHIANQG